jgi:choline dehydrogenase-like flavoprotein
VHRSIHEHLADGYVHCDICVIGSGPAGLAVISTLLDTDYRVLLLESGEQTVSNEHQILNIGQNSGSRYLNLEASRVRTFGGAGKIWAGVCRPFEPREFSKIIDNPLAKWPIAYQELDPYYREAAQLLEIDYPKFFSNEWRDSALLPQYFPGLAQKNSLLSGLGFEQSSTSARDLTNKLGDAIYASRNVTLVTDATVCDFLAGDRRADSYPVNELIVRSISGFEGRVRPTCIVLAAGALENPRLLMASSLPESIINLEHLGRCFMSHPGFLGVGHLHVGPNPMCHVPQPVTMKYFNFETNVEQRALARILRHGFSFTPVETRHAETEWESQHVVEPFSQTVYQNLNVLNVFKAIKCFISAGQRISPDWRIDIGLEQEPLLRNQVKLLQRKDKLGVPIVDVRWGEISRQEKDTVLIALRILARQAVISNIGIVEISPSLTSGKVFDQQDAINHHIGTTRMSVDKRYGVVDKNLQLFGTTNLFVAGSSVFPTSSIVNPTYTILALSLRLGEHIKYQMRH